MKPIYFVCEILCTIHQAFEQRKTLLKANPFFMAPVKIPFLSCPFLLQYCSLASLTSRIGVSCTHLFLQHSTEPALSFAVWMTTGHLSIGKQEKKKKLTMVHLRKAARWQFRWAYQYFYPLNSDYSKVICIVLFGFILWEVSDVSDVSGYLIPQRSPKVRER